MNPDADPGADPDGGTDPSSLELAGELRLLGRTATSSAQEGFSGDSDEDAVVAAVMGRLAAGAPSEPWLPRPRRRRRTLIALAVVLLSLLGVPAVRAAVVDLFSFDGVRVEIRPPSGPRGSPSPPPAAAGRTSLAAAARLVAFTPVVLRALGPPDHVEVSADRRVLSLSWDDPAAGTIRLDEFDGALDYAFAKTASDAEWVTVGGTSALWFLDPHEVSVLDAAGDPRTEPPRLAGDTLIWESGGTALRLEGGLSRDRAVEIAASAEPLT